MQLPNMEEINRARALVYGVMPATPQYSWPLLNQRLGTEAWIKHENHSPVGAFKLRGALVYVSWLKETIPTLKTVVAATRGNHGQGVALAAKMMGLRAGMRWRRNTRTARLKSSASFRRRPRLTLLSFRQYRVVEAPSATKIADGLACRVPNTDAMASIWEHVSRFVEVSDEEVKAAMRAYFEDTHNVAEGAALAGAMQERASLNVETIGVVLTGGNVDREVYLKVLQGGI